jgi:GT2 family glycosyltransferase
MLRLVERDPDVALTGEVVDLVGFYPADYRLQAERIDQVAVVEFEWETEPRKFEWKQGDFVYIPPYCAHQHFNADPANAYFFASNNMLCRRERLIALGGFDTAFPRAGAEDRDFCDRWRAAGLRLVWQVDATIEHCHGQSLATFIDLHYRYGRGARLYHAKRQARTTGTMREDLGFHRSLPSRIWKRMGRPLGPWRSVQVCGAILLWEAVNAIGFLQRGGRCTRQ